MTTENEKTNNVDLPSRVTEKEATFLFLYHLDMAAAYFEGTPLKDELLATFDEQNPDLNSTTTRSKRAFIEALDSEYADDQALSESLGETGA